MAKQPRECDERVSSAMSASTRAGERGREGLHGQLGAIVGVVGAHITCETGTSSTHVRYEPRASRSRFRSWRRTGQARNGDKDKRGCEGLDGHAGAAIDLASIACERGTG